MDTVDRKTRSRVMAAVKSKGNRSTERRFRSMLIRSKFRGWRIHGRDLPGTPDFIFDNAKLAIFIDGCFWHGCPTCYRRPNSEQEYWDAKLKRNITRDKRISAKLRRAGWSVVRIWEHSLSEPTSVIKRIKRKLENRTKLAVIKVS